MSEVATSFPHYKKPPIVERVLSATANITQENFFARLEEWKHVIGEKFPEYDPLNDWRVNIETREDGTPLLTEIQPELLITHRFWRRDKENRRFLSMRLMPNQLTLNIHPAPEGDHLFKELHEEFSNWLPQWMTHFGATGCETVSLNYINLISQITTPQFVDVNGSIQIGKALRVFAGIPSQHMGIIPPYDCQMGLMIDPEKPAMFSLRVVVVALAKYNSPAIRVDLNAYVAKPKPSLTAFQALSEADSLHNVINAQFEAIFTDIAKKSFDPVTVLTDKIKK
jgi:hypothetical protein